MSDPQNDPVLNALTAIFESLRDAQGLTLEGLADKTSIHRTTIGLIERNQRSPSFTVASEIANGLGYPLSDLVSKAELIASGKLTAQEAFAEEAARVLGEKVLCNKSKFADLTKMSSSSLADAVASVYHTLDMIDDQLTARGSLPLAKLVELANLSSMVGNLFGAAMADKSDGLYLRNKPHTSPDLLPQTGDVGPLELKMALEKNMPKGHLAKAGRYITCRYVLGSRTGAYERGGRGDAVWIWEIRVGDLTDSDFGISNTDGDSGKTATIKAESLYNLPLVFFDSRFCPHPIKNGKYVGNVNAPADDGL